MLSLHVTVIRLYIKDSTCGFVARPIFQALELNFHIMLTQHQPLQNIFIPCALIVLSRIELLGSSLG